MTSKKNLPETAPHFEEGHMVTFAVTVVSGLISALALAYHVHRDAEIGEEAVKWAFVILSGLFAFGMAMAPISLARAHGESFEGGNAQTGLLIIVLMLMAIDGALQVHAIKFLVETFHGAKAPSTWILAIGAGLFQLAMFFVRGNLYAAHTEIQSLIDGREQEARMAEIHAREAHNARRREQYALKSIKGGRT